MLTGHDSPRRRQAGRPGSARIPGCKGLFALALLIAVPGHSQAAIAEAPTSSTTVEIRLSVAPTMRLLAMNGMDGAADKAPGGRYCAMSNASEAALPVYLAWPESEPARAETAGQDQRALLPHRLEISRCGGKEAAPSDTAAAKPGPGADLALIYPE